VRRRRLDETSKDPWNASPATWTSTPAPGYEYAQVRPTHMLDLHKKLAAATIPADKNLYQRQIEATDQEIDALVYELYGMSEEEIGVVVGAQT
jgi:hypothetical protein